MSFTENEYLQWYIAKLGEKEAINLHSSGVRALGLEEAQPVLDGNPWELSDRFAGALAHWLDIAEDQVVFTSGATGGTLLSLLGLVEPENGREFLVEGPIYEPLRAQAAALGSVNRFWCRPADCWRMPFGSIEELISDQTSMVMITEPTNPGGLSRPRQEILDLASLAEKHGALLLINEVYRGFTDEPSYHLERDNIVIVSSLSKLFGAYAFRLGWVSASAERIASLKVAHMNLSAPSSPSAAAGLGLMARAEELQAEAKRLARSGIATVDDWVNSVPEISWHRPPSMGFGCITMPEHALDDVAFAEALYEQHDVLTIPGTFFDAPGTLRLSWLQAGDQMERGLELVGKQLNRRA